MHREWTFRLGCLAASLLVAGNASAVEWARFRGPNGGGVATDPAVPSEWSDDKNLAWKVELPGPGTSSPIIIGDLVLITCYTGYGTSLEQPGQLSNLKRHLLAFDVATGNKKWEATVDGTPTEDPYRGFIAEHGYASNTPVSDGQRIFVFFGKAGVLAYDLAGNELWKKNVGQESGPQHWGSGASPILINNLVIVNASEESSAMVALDQSTGDEVWRAEAEGLGNTWGTPIVMGAGDQAEIVLGVPNEIWGFSPKTGKLRWFADALQDNSYCSSVVTDGKLIFGIEGRSGQAIAVRPGGEKDVTKTHIVWKERGQSRVCTPLFYDGLLYSVSRGVVQCLDAENGKPVYQKRLGSSTEVVEQPNESRSGGPGDGEPGRGGRGGQGGGRGGRGGRGGGGGGGQDYSSPIVVNGNIIFVTRGGVAHVWQAGQEFKPVAQNRFASDDSRYNATPSVANGKLWLRSDKCLYCIAQK